MLESILEHSLRWENFDCPRREAWRAPAFRFFTGEKMENLILAGRCISGTHEAMASYRVMAIAMAIGEAAGIGAALAIDHDVTPENLDVKYIQKALMDKGAVLFDEK